MNNLLRYFPELEGKIDFVDFGSALTNDFYLGTHRGAVYGMAHTPQRFQQHWLQCQTPVKNLLLTGQDICSCGVCGALVGGYLCASRLSLRCVWETLLFW